LKKRAAAVGIRRFGIGLSDKTNVSTVYPEETAAVVKRNNLK
jgi:hypothetical protein